MNDYPITKEFLNKARSHIKKYPPYAKDDPIWDVYDGGKSFERCQSTMLIQLFEELEIDPYDDNDYGNIKD